VNNELKGLSWLLAIALSHVVAAHAVAQIHVPAYTGTPLMISSGVVTQQTLNRQIAITEQGYRANSGRSAETSRAATAAISTLFLGEQRTSVPAKLASRYGPAQDEAHKVFAQMLAGYAKIEQQFGIPRNDVAGSVAAFVAGSWMAYRNVDFPDEHFKPLVQQMRGVIGSNPDFAKASNADKQEMYEQMAILGMFMATTQMALKEKPNPQVAANMKQAAKGYLEQFLKTDAERVQITAQGLVLR
jgi:hypothetical protein